MNVPYVTARKRKRESPAEKNFPSQRTRSVVRGRSRWIPARDGTGAMACICPFPSGLATEAPSSHPSHLREPTLLTVGTNPFREPFDPEPGLSVVGHTRGAGPGNPWSLCKVLFHLGRENRP